MTMLKSVLAPIAVVSALKNIENQALKNLETKIKYITDLNEEKDRLFLEARQLADLARQYISSQCPTTYDQEFEPGFFNEVFQAAKNAKETFKEKITEQSDIHDKYVAVDDVDIAEYCEAVNDDDVNDDDPSVNKDPPVNKDGIEFLQKKYSTVHAFAKALGVDLTEGETFATLQTKNKERIRDLMASELAATRQYILNKLLNEEFLEKVDAFSKANSNSEAFRNLLLTNFVDHSTPVQNVHTEIVALTQLAAAAVNEEDVKVVQKWRTSVPTKANDQGFFNKVLEQIEDTDNFEKFMEKIGQVHNEQKDNALKALKEQKDNALKALKEQKDNVMKNIVTKWLSSMKVDDHSWETVLKIIKEQTKIKDDEANPVTDLKGLETLISDNFEDVVQISSHVHNALQKTSYLPVMFVATTVFIALIYFFCRMYFVEEEPEKIASMPEDGQSGWFLSFP